MTPDWPIGIDVFDAERQAFLRALRAFLADPAVSLDHKHEEANITISAIRQIVALTPVPL